MEVLPPPAIPEKSPQIVYELEDHVPLGPAVLVGLQDVSAMVIGTLTPPPVLAGGVGLVGLRLVPAMVIGPITPPLILAGALNFSPADTAYLISVALLASAFGTWLQCRQRGPVGSGLLSVTGTSFSFLQPLTLA